MAIFDLDSDCVRESRIFVANINGAQADDGVCVEIGIAYESRRNREKYNFEKGVEVMIAYFNDTRCLMPNIKRNPMVMGPF